MHGGFHCESSFDKICLLIPCGSDSLASLRASWKYQKAMFDPKRDRFRKEEEKKKKTHNASCSCAMKYRYRKSRNNSLRKIPMSTLASFV